jgi:tRNA-dihydrouridine synthase
VLHEFVEKIQDAGVKGIAVHARTAQQGYSGHADWDYIKRIKSLLSIPVIGNGDIHSAQEVFEKLEGNYCDLVMIGRAAWNAPEICPLSAKKFATTIASFAFFHFLPSSNPFLIACAILCSSSITSILMLLIIFHKLKIS